MVMEILRGHDSARRAGVNPRDALQDRACQERELEGMSLNVTCATSRGVFISLCYEMGSIWNCSRMPIIFAIRVTF